MSKIARKLKEGGIWDFFEGKMSEGGTLDIVKMLSAGEEGEALFLGAGASIFQP